MKNEERVKLGNTLLFAVLFTTLALSVTVGCASGGKAPEEEWNKTFGGTGYEHAYSIQQTADGDYILAGVTSSYGAGYSDFWLVKTDSGGNEQWNKTFGGAGDEIFGWDGAHSVQQTSDGGYILAGETYPYGAGNYDFWRIKLKREPIISIFDTDKGTYPSIMGTHTGTITPSHNINVSKLYTYACVGTGGHTESIKLYDENDTLIANGSWNGYIGDYHNIIIHNLTGEAPYVTLLKKHEYRYVIKTGSYPQIIHNQTFTNEYGTITCTSFMNANGKRYTDWIPAIRLWT